MSELSIDLHHPKRLHLTQELHARPFPVIDGPSEIAVIAFKEVDNAAQRDRSLDRAHLLELLDHYSTPHPSDLAGHFYGDIGLATLKWEQHTEFVTFTVIVKGNEAKAFDGDPFRFFPKSWLQKAPSKVITSAHIRVESVKNATEARERLETNAQSWFVDESHCAAYISSKEALVTSDFRIDPNGHIRFAVFADQLIDKRRLGRVVQRLIEIEIYKSMAMLTLPVALDVASQVDGLDYKISKLAEAITTQNEDSAKLLDELLAISAEIELLATHSSFRFGAANAYADILRARIDVLREERIGAFQLFSEFALRRFEPAMRRCVSAENRLKDISLRASKISSLLQTRVDVDIATQNRSLLNSMDRRAELQLRLQETVEGLSVVAITYYLTSLLGYISLPFFKHLGLSKEWAMTLIALPTLFIVFMGLKLLRKKMK